MTEQVNNSGWWGDFILQPEQSRQWQIGQLNLIVRCLPNEWQVAQQPITDFDENSVFCSLNDTEELPESLAENSRFISGNNTNQLTITPRLADRPIITRPITPFHLTAGEDITLYVSSPLWLEIACGNTTKKVLKTVATQRLSDTWFGPSTLEGELCYASTTHCRLTLEEIPHRPHRAITPVLIRNQAQSTLSLERLKLPAPMLSVYSSADGRLWTSQISLRREKDGDFAELKIDNASYDNDSDMLKVGDPRSNNRNGALFRAFNAIFS